VRTYHPEIVAIAMLIVSWLVRVSEAHGVMVTQDTEDGLIMATAYVLLWAKRRWFKPVMAAPSLPNNDNERKQP
jgi:hypothetical protein